MDMFRFPHRATRTDEGRPNRHHPALVARLEGMSFEVFPSSKLGEQARALPPGARVSVTCSPKSGIASTLSAAVTLLPHGHRVVPHLAARMVGADVDLTSITKWLSGHGVREVLVIGGDASPPRGPYEDARSCIEALVSSGVALDGVGLGGYPDGHALIPAQKLTEALLEKQELLDRAGLPGWVSTQMCFDPDKIRKWIGDLRNEGLHLPIHLGVPGAVDKTKLLSMGMRLGIGASLRFLRGNRASISRLVAPGGYDPMQLLAPLASEFDALGIDRLHIFTFNQVAATAAWQRAALEP